MHERDTTRWIWRAGALTALVIGWVFIAWKNHFHITAPLVFVCLGYLAVVATIYNLWRTGAAAVAGSEDDGDSTWAKPVGALGELEREKRTLLKAIKEAEFDHQMGKLSQRDVDDMIRTYRARAIEVIKEIDRLGTGATGTTREQIMREVRARLELEARSQKKPEMKPDAKPGATLDAKAEPKPAARAQAADKATEAGKPGKAKKKSKAGAPDEPATAEALAAGSHANGTASGSPGGAEADAAADTATAAAQANEQAAHGRAQAAAAAQALDDELNADSTTTVEPKRDDPAKEATP